MPLVDLCRSVAPDLAGVQVDITKFPRKGSLSLLGCSVSGNQNFVCFVRDGMSDQLTAGITLHELAHWLDGTADPKATRRDQHGPRFIRACIHLAHRARIHPRLLRVCGAAYNLSSLRDYVTALGREPREQAAAPIRSILNSPAPAAFVRLWEEDASR